MSNDVRVQIEVEDRTRPGTTTQVPPSSTVVPAPVGAAAGTSSFVVGGFAPPGAATAVPAPGQPGTPVPPLIAPPIQPPVAPPPVGAPGGRGGGAQGPGSDAVSQLRGMTFALGRVTLVLFVFRRLLDTINNLFTETIDSLAEFSPELQRAQAEREVALLLTRRQLAQELGAELATVTRDRTRTALAFERARAETVSQLGSIQSAVSDTSVAISGLLPRILRVMPQARAVSEILESTETIRKEILRRLDLEPEIPESGEAEVDEFFANPLRQFPEIANEGNPRQALD